VCISSKEDVDDVAKVVIGLRCGALEHVIAPPPLLNGAAFSLLEVIVESQVETLNLVSCSLVV
jgi:hypothetical protein